MSSITKIICWDDIDNDIGSDLSQFQEWLEDNEVTTFVTGIFEKDYKVFRNEKKNVR